MTAKTRATRAGFTLVEILMVIAIIAILASLLFVAISKVGQTARKVQARNDLTQLETVMATFKKEFGFYPPSHVTLQNGTVARFMVPAYYPDPTNTSPTAAQQQNNASFQILQRMFPRWQPAYNASYQISDYDTLTASYAGKPMDPNQALVFFLSGASASGTVGSGFEVARPYVPTGATKKGPYFEFPPARINSNTQFMDPWGTPYAYFAANGDSYDPRVCFPWATDPANGTYDPSTDAVGVAHPYFSNGKWINPSKFQLVSAGPDKLFGPGSQFTTNGSGVLTLGAAVWDSKNPQGGALSATYYGEKSRGEDDLANFNEGGSLGTSSAP